MGKQEKNRIRDEAYEVVRAYKKARTLSFSLFVAITLLLIAGLVAAALSIVGKDVQALLISAALSLCTSLVLTLFFSLVVEPAQNKVDIATRKLEVTEIEKVGMQTVSLVKDEIYTVLEERTSRLLKHFPEYLFAQVFPQGASPDQRFLEVLGTAVSQSQTYRFRGGTARFCAGLLTEHAKVGTECKVFVIDPRDAKAIRLYASDRYAVLNSRSLAEHESDVRDEIFGAIVKLFELRGRFHIEVRTHVDHLFYRTELVDDGAFVVYYTGDRQAVFPPAYYYTKEQGMFYFLAFHKDFQQSWDYGNTAEFVMGAELGDEDLKRFLQVLGATPEESSDNRLVAWRSSSEPHY